MTTLRQDIGSLLKHGNCSTCGLPLASLQFQCEHVAHGLALRKSLDTLEQHLEQALKLLREP